MTTLNISEIFYSIQGEGKLVGTPSIFIRTSGCNLRCVWCDTPYTSWEPEKNLMSVEHILEEVQRYSDCDAVVLTGGEPMLQNIEELVHALKEEGLHVTIETNGTIYRELPVDLISLSPKLSNSTPHGKWQREHDARRVNINVLAEYIRSGIDYQLKFVVDKKSDIAEIQQLLADLKREVSVTPANVVLMPQGKTKEEIQSKYEMLVELCLKNNFRLSPRLHVDIWGDKRGV